MKDGSFSIAQIRYVSTCRYERILVLDQIPIDTSYYNIGNYARLSGATFVCRTPTTGGFTERAGETVGIALSRLILVSME